MTETLVDTRAHHGGSSEYNGGSSTNEQQQQQQQHASSAPAANGPLKASTINGDVNSSSSSSNGSSSNGSSKQRQGKLRPDVNPANGNHDGADVGIVMLKAKKAAQSIWVLVHAQNCRIGGDRCPHKGCTEAKRVLLHIKTCPAANNACSCPMQYNGCQQSRKLLAHYQKCREIRAKQAGMGRRAKNHQHVCLVCSLVARHARNVLEAGTSSRKSNIKTNKQVIASFTLAEPGPDIVIAPASAPSSNGFMPPPPPRQRAIPVPTMKVTSSSDSSSDDGIASESPPARNQLFLFSEVAAAAAPPPIPNALGKSLDSSKSPFLTFAASALQNLKKASPTGSDDDEQHQQPMYSPRRSRAESYDERAHTHHLTPNSRMHHRHEGSDPTLELDLKGEQTFGDGEVIIRRSRSASLGVLASACSVSRNNGGCDTIVEEANAAAREEVAFAMDEDHYL